MKKMNYLWLLGLMVFTAVNFASCSNDDEADPSHLVGLWETVSYQGWEKEDGVIYDEWNEYESDWRIRLDEDGSCCSYEDDYGKWELEMTGKWKCENRVLYIVPDEYSSFERIGTIKELTSSRLILEDYHKETHEGTTFEVYESMTMKRIE